MSAYLIDTNIISNLSPARAGVSEAFVRWLERQDAEGQIFLSVVTIHEIEKGISLLEHKGATKKAAGLREWLSGLVSLYDNRILAVDASAASLSGALEAMAVASGHNPGMADALIAGIAKVHGLTVITENTKHFIPFGVHAISPEDALR